MEKVFKENKMGTNNSQKNTIVKKEAPTGVNFIGSWFLVIGGILLFIGFWAIGTTLFWENKLSEIIYYLGLGIILIFTSLNLFKGKNWAKISATSLSILYVIVFIIQSILTDWPMGLTFLSPSIIIGFLFIPIEFTNKLVESVSLIILYSLPYLVIASYLLFNKKAKQFFKN